MKVKVVLTKGFKNSKITRTLNLGKSSHSKTAQSSLKDLTINTTNNNLEANKKISNKSKTKSKNKSKNKNIQQSNSKSKSKKNHISIKAKDKTMDKNISQIDQNNQNNTISNINPYKKIHILQEKKKNFIKKEKSFSNYNVKRFKHNNTYNYDNHNIINKKLFKTPIRIRKIFGRQGSGIKNININNDSKVNRQYLNTVYFNNIEKSNNTNTIMNLQKELESLKRENLYKTMLISNMKQQIEEYQKQQQIMQENNLLKEQIQLLKNNINNKNNNNKNANNNNISKNIELFDKLKYEYLTSQNQVNELKKENTQLKNNLNRINKNISIQKNIDIILQEKENHKNLSNISNNNNQIKQNNSLNQYIENTYKLALKKENEDINNYYKPLKEEQKKEIHFLIKMTLISNHIKKDKLLNILLNNLTNLNDILNIIITDFLKMNSTFDKILVKNYFTLICLRAGANKIKSFNINNLFFEINNFYIDVDKIKSKYMRQKIYNFLSNNQNIKQLINECKLKDQFNVGIIELNQFNEIFIGAYGNFINNEKNRELYNLFIYVMKNYYDLNELGLYHLNYQNLDCDTYQKKFSSIKNVNNYENDNLGQNENNIAQEFFNKRYFTVINSNNNSENSSVRSSKNKNKISNEDIVANVSINVDHSTALVNVKFKNHYDSDYDSNSVVQTSINGMYSNKNNNISLIDKNNNDEENIFLTSGDYQVCMDFVANVFEFCLEKLKRDKKNENKIFYEDFI